MAPSSLSTDVRLLGDTLGEVLRAHGGDALFEHVERMRQAAKRAHDADDVASSHKAIRGEAPVSAAVSVPTGSL